MSVLSFSNPSYTLFRKELHNLLQSNGILPNRLPVLSGNTPESKWTLPQDDIKQKVGKVILYMENHLTEELSLDEMAAKMEMSKYQLIRGFRKEEGTTPWKFLMQKRIDNVKDLLEEGMSPGQAAVESGFYDQSHLNKVFRKFTGKTPKEYQEENFRNRN